VIEDASVVVGSAQVGAIFPTVVIANCLIWIFTSETFEEELEVVER